MSRFLKIPNEAYTRRCLSQRFIRYNFYEPNVEFGILPEDPEKTELDFLQSVLRNMGPNSRMYGSAQELLENLKIYANFPGNDNFFDTKYEPYQNSPTFYYSLKDSDKYVAKPDLFVILQNIMFIISDTPGFSFLSILIGHLKLQEQRLGSNFEFVKCDESILEAFYNSMLRIVNMHKITDDEFEKTRAKYEQMSVDEILKDLKKLTPKSWDKNEDETMRRLTNFVTHASDSTQKSIIFAQLAAISVSCIRAVERVVDYDGEIYCLHHSISYFRKKITVRVFEDGKERFVMNKELFDAFIASGFECSPIGGDYCYTTAMRDVYREFKQYIQDIEFIRYPITRAKHRATPVKAPSIDGAESLVILAIDAFFEIFRYSIFRLKLLQLESKGFELLKQMIPVFLQLNDNSNTVYFIPLLMFDEFEKQYYQEINNSHSGPLTEVLDVGKDGFTVEHLKEELVNCGLTRYCPEAIEHAEAVYSEVNRIKKEGILRTCDMFDAIEHCSLLCVLEQIPEVSVDVICVLLVLVLKNLNFFGFRKLNFQGLNIFCPGNGQICTWYVFQVILTWWTNFCKLGFLGHHVKIS
ncbi:hypothetical protein B9Z55_004353 [Caenorhabditis nigoni]|uniref:DUF7809 domain-containing protein n=1 Tax=Caenorhabditis nigoni TaxID=1611254 RepID=A0A2G5UW25_9PELO|nr:hypothetical protein B9Z55_004353 [Caenorhabditis nigoni]